MSKLFPGIIYNKHDLINLENKMQLRFHIQVFLYTEKYETDKSFEDLN